MSRPAPAPQKKTELFSFAAVGFEQQKIVPSTNFIDAV
jgi:hypothetical protein